MQNKEFWTVAEVAQRFGVTIRTVRRWIATGDLKAIRMPGGHFRIPNEEIERLRRPVA